MTMLFLAGAQKSGTSSLFRTLIEHSQIQAAMDSKGNIVKELQFHSKKYKTHYVHWYTSHWRFNTRYQIDATPNYTTKKGAIKRMVTMHPDARYLMILRDPIHRAVSAYNHYMQEYPKTLNWDWRKPHESFHANVVAEIEKPFKGFRGIVGRGRYIEQYDFLRRFVPRERIFLITFNAFFGDRSLQALEAIENWLGLDHEDLDTNKHVHKRDYTFKDLDIEPRTLSILEEYYRQPTDQIMPHVDFK